MRLSAKKNSTVKSSQQSFIKNITTSSQNNQPSDGKGLLRRGLNRYHQ